MNIKISNKFQDFIKKYDVIGYKKGQVLFRAGENLNTAYIEKSGYLRAYLVFNGKESSLPSLRPLKYCVGMSGLYKKSNKYFVEAITAVDLWAVPMNDLINFVQENEDIKKEYDAILMESLIKLSENWQQIVAGDAESKVAGLLYMIGKEIGEKRKGEVFININTPHRVLASMVGLTRETVTLQILKFQKEGLLYNNKRKMVIKKIEKLKEIAKI